MHVNSQYLNWKGKERKGKERKGKGKQDKPNFENSPYRSPAVFSSSVRSVCASPTRTFSEENKNEGSNKYNNCRQKP
jgi:hypothetical protein